MHIMHPNQNQHHPFSVQIFQQFYRTWLWPKWLLPAHQQYQEIVLLSLQDATKVFNAEGTSTSTSSYLNWVLTLKEENDKSKVNCIMILLDMVSVTFAVFCQHQYYFHSNRLFLFFFDTVGTFLIISSTFQALPFSCCTSPPLFSKTKHTLIYDVVWKK